MRLNQKRRRVYKGKSWRHAEGESGMYDADNLAPGPTPEITDLFTSVLRKVEHRGPQWSCTGGTR